MKTLVQWHGQKCENAFQFVGITEDSCQTHLSGRNASGTKENSSPKEVVAMGQAACTGIDVVSTLKKMREPLEELTISCDVNLTQQQPSVFETCKMIYDVKGCELNPEKVAHAVSLSLIKYCGVSAMIERSGCNLIPSLFVNNQEISIWDPFSRQAHALREWASAHASQTPRGLALIIGGSRGIGRALSQNLCDMGFGVVTASRSPIDGVRSLFEFERIQLDITNPLSRSAFVSLIRNSGVSFDLIIFNSGSIDHRAHSASQTDFTELEAIFDTNLFSIIDLNNQLLFSLKSKSSLLFISSYMGLPSCNDSNFSSYRLSKCALTFFARQLGREMNAQNRDIAIAAIHPGSVLTKLNPNGRIAPEDSAKRISLLFNEERREQMLSRNGEFWMVQERSESILPWDI